MEGLRVIELAMWVAGPAVGGILADWGADVVKIEPPAGDPFRAFFRVTSGADLPVNPPFELDNRGKRSVAIDIAKTEGAQLVADMAAKADVFVTNVRPKVLKRAGLDYADLAARNPRLVYGRVTGYGESGPEHERAAYDLGAYWSRAGIASSLTVPGAQPPYQRGGFGDHTTALSLLNGILAALLVRERTGKGQFVATSLMRTGTYIIGFDLNTTVRLGIAFPQPTRTTMPNVLTTCYRARDDRWFWLLGLQADRHWPDLAAAIDKPEWVQDARFKDIRARRENCAELVGLLDEIFATRDLEDWGRRFDEAGMWWAPVQTLEEVVADPQAEAAGSFCEVPLPDGGTTRMISSPVDFSGTPWQPRSPVPEHGQHTEEVLLELGYDWEAIGALKEKGVIP
jgi:crotonobetainyl-CoA:carnitine CoA-transferase CaiB-like acyl-CoA transferase